jgi:hypothetical protein
MTRQAMYEAILRVEKALEQMEEARIGLDTHLQWLQNEYIIATAKRTSKGG